MLVHQTGLSPVFVMDPTVCLFATLILMFGNLMSCREQDGCVRMRPRRARLGKPGSQFRHPVRSPPHHAKE